MWAREAYPKGEASELVSATSRSGPRIRREGMMGGTGEPLGVLSQRYSAPVVAANSDWIVFRNTGYLKTSVLPGGPCGVVVSFSWRYAHVRLGVANRSCQCQSSSRYCCLRVEVLKALNSQ